MVKVYSGHGGKAPHILQKMKVNVYICVPAMERLVVYWTLQLFLIWWKLKSSFCLSEHAKTYGSSGDAAPHILP